MSNETTKETREDILKRAEQFMDGPALNIGDSAKYLEKTPNAMRAIIKRFKLKRRKKGLGKSVYILVKDLDNILTQEYILGDDEEENDDMA